MTTPEDENKKITKAVSLKYDGDGAPRVVAKGSGYVADEILKIAKEFDIPLYQDDGLTDVLATIELNNEIPENLYVAVAEVIAFAYRINQKRMNFSLKDSHPPK